MFMGELSWKEICMLTKGVAILVVTVAILGAIIVLSIAGCEQEATNEYEICAPRSGSYTVKYTETYGNCGGIPSITSVILEGYNQTEFYDTCDGYQDISPDKCRLTTEVVCPLNKRINSAFKLAGYIQWDSLGEYAEGKVQFSIKTFFGELCSSIYNIIYSR